MGAEAPEGPAARGLGGSVRADAAGQTLRSIVTALRAARTHAPNDAALARASLISDYRAQTASSVALANLGARAVAAGLPLASIETYPARVAAVTEGDTLRVANKYLNDGALRVIAQGSKEVVGDLEKLGLGPVKRHDVAIELRDGSQPLPPTRRR